MKYESVTSWLESVSGGDQVWYVKRLSANDTLATGAHQAGPYISKPLGELLFPGFFTNVRPNPEHRFPVRIDSHVASERTVRGVWYNNRVTGGGTRNELRITGWGGKESPLLDPESTGSLAVLAFQLDGNVQSGRVWICRSVSEEEEVESIVGPVEPKTGLLFRPGMGLQGGLPFKPDCRLLPHEIPISWRTAFPAAEEIVTFAIEKSASWSSSPPDQRLVSRRDCEYDLFRSVEEQLVFPRIREGFESVDAFVAFAGTVSNRRKARAGRSLELHLKRIFVEEGLSFSHGEVSEGNKRPDFLFPGSYHYRNRAYPADSLRMLGAKTTCKDRWRQVLNEADRIRTKHLFTLQEGVSENQFREMEEAGVQLVVPAAVQDRYPRSIRARLQTLRDFIDECRTVTF